MEEQGASYRQLKLTAAMGFGALGRSLCGAVEGKMMEKGPKSSSAPVLWFSVSRGVQGMVLLHLDLTAGLPCKPRIHVFPRPMQLS